MKRTPTGFAKSVILTGSHSPTIATGDSSRDRYGFSLSPTKMGLFPPLRGLLAGSLYFDPRRAQQSLTSLLNALLALLGGATGRLTFFPEGRWRTAPAPGPNTTKRGPSELERCWNTNLG
eukprot:scaffold12839_cov125-Isochrysis_galbana.AAC.3